MEVRWRSWLEGAVEGGSWPGVKAPLLGLCSAALLCPAVQVAHSSGWWAYWGWCGERRVLNGLPLGRRFCWRKILGLEADMLTRGVTWTLQAALSSDPTIMLQEEDWWLKHCMCFLPLALPRPLYCPIPSFPSLFHLFTPTNHKTVLSFSPFSARWRLNHQLQIRFPYCH